MSGIRLTSMIHCVKYQKWKKVKNSSASVNFLKHVETYLTKYVSLEQNEKKIHVT